MKTILASAAALLLATIATAQAADDLYRNKTLKVIVGAATGAGYDAQARLIARHIGKYIPGEKLVGSGE